MKFGKLRKTWDVNAVLACNYKSERPNRRMINFNYAWEQVKDCHRQIWPGVPVPPRYSHGIKSQMVASLPTSVVFATFVWGVSTPKRSPDARSISAGSFVAFLKKICEGGVDISFPVFEADGSLACVRQVRIDPDNFVISCWSDSLSDMASVAWDRDYMDHELHFPLTPRSATSLFDLLLWALKPLPLKYKDENLKSCKRLLSITGFTILTYLCQHLENVVLPNIFGLEERLAPHSSESEADFFIQSRKRRKCTTPTFAVNEITSRVAKLLFSGEEACHVGTCFFCRNPSQKTVTWKALIEFNRG